MPPKARAEGGRPARSAPKKLRAKKTDQTRAKTVDRSTDMKNLLPHEVLLAVARGEVIADHVPTFDERVEAAKAAAPYFAPKSPAAASLRTGRKQASLDHEAALLALDQEVASGPGELKSSDEDTADVADES